MPAFLRLCLVAMALVMPGLNAQAEMPSHAEFSAALEAARPHGHALDLRLQTGALWRTLLRDRVPMQAAYQAGVCHIDYSSYVPGRDFSALFPRLDASRRRAWLAGVMAHEIAHCVDRRERSSAPLAEASGAYTGNDSGADQAGEVRADIAFALFLLRHTDHGIELVERLIQVRQGRATIDPIHDSSQALRCMLGVPASQLDALSWTEATRQLTESCAR